MAKARTEEKEPGKRRMPRLRGITRRYLLQACGGMGEEGSLLGEGCGAAAEKDAEQQLAATSERYKETKVTAREARQRLEAAEERSREAETRPPRPRASTSSRDRRRPWSRPRKLFWRFRRPLGS